MRQERLSRAGETRRWDLDAKVVAHTNVALAPVPKRGHLEWGPLLALPIVIEGMLYVQHTQTLFRWMRRRGRDSCTSVLRIRSGHWPAPYDGRIVCTRIVFFLLLP